MPGRDILRRAAQAAERWERRALGEAAGTGRHPSYRQMMIFVFADQAISYRAGSVNVMDIPLFTAELYNVIQQRAAQPMRSVTPF